MAGDILLPLEQAQDVKYVGGKAASLGAMLRAGFKALGGFVISTKSGMKMSPQLEAEIFVHFDKLGAKKVAVRSSAVAEDGKKDAWAGQFDTFLNTDRDNLIKNIEKCWASASSERALAYAEEKGIKSGAVAVIVQQMIDSNFTGVAFSVHPVTNDKEKMVIEAVKGLGDKLVSGLVTPDTYIINKSGLSLEQASLVGSKPILSSKDLIRVAELTVKIEDFYGFAVDIEWTIADGQLYAMQSRPITTL